MAYFAEKADQITHEVQNDASVMVTLRKDGKVASFSLSGVEPDSIEISADSRFLNFVTVEEKAPISLEVSALVPSGLF